MNFKVIIVSLMTCFMVIPSQAETYHWNITKEQRAGLRADLLNKAQEIESRMLSEKHERLVGYLSKGSFWLGIGAGCVGLAVYFYWQYALSKKYIDYKTEKGLLDSFMFRYKLFKHTKAFENMSYDDAKNHVILLNSWVKKLNKSADELNNVTYISDMLNNTSLFASISCFFLGLVSYREGGLREQLLEIKNKIAELDALDAAEIQNGVVKKFK